MAKALVKNVINNVTHGHVGSNDVVDLEAAVHVLTKLSNQPYIIPLASKWCQHAAAHLQVRLERELRPGPSPMTTEHAMHDVIRGMGRSLRQAAEALDKAAYALRDKGATMPANHAKRAATAAYEAASVTEE